MVIGEGIFNKKLRRMLRWEVLVSKLIANNKVYPKCRALSEYFLNIICPNIWLDAIWNILNDC